MVTIERVWGGVKITYTNDGERPVQGGFNTYVDGAIQETHAPREEFGIVPPGQTMSAVFPLSTWRVPGGEKLRGKHNIAAEFLPLNPDVQFGLGLPGEFVGPTEMSNAVTADFSPFPWLPLGLVVGGVITAVAIGRKQPKKG